MKLILQRFTVLIFILILWEIIYILELLPVLLFPSIRSIFMALYNGISSGNFLLMTWNTMNTIFIGLAVGIIIALALAGLSRIHNFFRTVIDTIVIVMNPIPGLAIFPLVILIVGLGRNALLVVLIHSVLWGLLLNLMAGIESISTTYKEVGLNLELNRFRMFTDIYIPASMPFIIPGLKAALARAWRSAIAVELIAGITANNAGLGWLMLRQRETLDISGLYATIIIIIIIGIILNEVLFRTLEVLTINRWGMGK